MFWVLVGLLLAQGVMVSRYTWVLLRWRSRGGDPSYCPKTAAILCVRGNDPVLNDCLTALLAQDYPSYAVRVVVDSTADPAWNVVRDVIGRLGSTHVQVQPLRDRRATCSRKISGMLQAIAGLDDSFQAVVLLDSDTIPYPTWLRELVAPLRDPRIGAASGNRCYVPDHLTWTNLFRCVWNAAALVQMYWYGIPWGGSMAVKTELFRRTDLLACWAAAFGEDNSLSRAIRRYGFRVAFVPSVMMINRDSSGFRGFQHFIQRQLLSVRTHNPWWWAVVAHGIATTCWLALAAGILLAAEIAGNRPATAWSVGALAGYLAGSMLLLAPMEIAIRRILAARGEPARWLGTVGVLKTVLAIPLTQVVYGVELIRAMFVRTHRWRNVLYRFGGNPPVEVVEDHPLDATTVIE
jgi:hypothetical protein